MANERHKPVMKESGKEAGTVKAEAEERAEHKETGKITYLETNIDRFYRFVKEKKRVSFYDAANEQDATREQIASWAKILEEHNLAKVRYPVFGPPVIMMEAEKPRKRFGEEREEGEKKTRKMAPKIIIALAGGLMVLFGYVMFVSNPFTITLRSQVTAAVQSFGLIFRFLPYPLNIITPVIIILAALFAVLRLRKKRAQGGMHKEDRRRQEKPSGKEQKHEKEKPEKERKKESKDIEDKLSKIKEELGS